MGVDDEIVDFGEMFDGVVDDGDTIAVYTFAPTDNRSFFADCERDDKGHCLPAVGGAERVSEIELQAAQAKAIAKGAQAPRPTKEDKAAAKAGLAKEAQERAKGRDYRYRRNLLGNSQDRAKRRDALLKEFGDGVKCPCVYCGIKVGHGTMEQDKIYTTREGGKYRVSNLVPACSGCNNARGDTPWKEIKWKKES